MTFHASLSLIAFSASVTLPALSQIVNLSNIFSNFSLVAFSFYPFSFHNNIIQLYSSFSLLITWPKKVAWRLHILFMDGLVVSASCDTVSFDFFAGHEIRSIVRKNHISFASVSFVTVLKLSRPRIHTSTLTGSSSHMNGDVIICKY